LLYSVTLEGATMTDMLENLGTEEVVRIKITRQRPNSSRLGLGKLTTLAQSERIRYGDQLDAKGERVSEIPLDFNGVPMIQRKRQLAEWLAGAFDPRTAEAIARKLRSKVNYVHWLPVSNGHVLIVEDESPKR
jgi:hypothetical protein